MTMYENGSDLLSPFPRLRTSLRGTVIIVVRGHMPFSVRFAVACMRGIGYHVAHAFSARCQVRVERRAACHGCRGAHNSSPALALAPILDLLYHDILVYRI